MLNVGTTVRLRTSARPHQPHDNKSLSAVIGHLPFYAALLQFMEREKETERVREERDEEAA